MKSILSLAAMALLAGSALSAQAAESPLAGLGRLDLIKQDLTIPGQEVVQVRVDFGKGVSAPKHSHPGEEVAFVLEGRLEYQLGEQAPVTLQAGQSLFIPAGVAHSARNVGAGEAKELATYIVEKGKPLVTLQGKQANASAHQH